MEKKQQLSDDTHLIQACGYTFGSAAAQSTQCSRVAGGSDEGAGWRWGFPALTSARPWHCAGAEGENLGEAQEVSLSTCCTAGFPAHRPDELPSSRRQTK